MTNCELMPKGGKATGPPKAWHKRKPAPESYSSLHPAWETEATGYMGLFQPSQDALDSLGGNRPAKLGLKRQDQPAAVAYINYSKTPAGKYKEFIVTLGIYSGAGQSGAVVANMPIKDNLATIEAGRTNWWLPKTAEDITVTESSGCTQIRVTRPGAPAPYIKVTFRENEESNLSKFFYESTKQDEASSTLLQPHLDVDQLQFRVSKSSMKSPAYWVDMEI